MSWRRFSPGVLVLSFEKGQWRFASGVCSLGLLVGLACGPAYAQGVPQAGDAQSVEPAPAGASHFDILAFQVHGNALLADDVVERAVYPFMGPQRSEADVENARAALQKAFDDAGYVGVAVLLPEQSVDGGVLRLDVAPQRVGQLLVEGDTKNAEAVRALAPSVAPGNTPNIPAFERDVIALNSKVSRKVTPELRAGVAPGTMDVVLKVEESSPLHASAELNNFSSAATTDLRASATIRHDDLWGLGHSISLSAQTAPRRTDDGTVFSGNYLLPLGRGTQLLAYYVHSDSDIAVVGGTNVVGKGDIAGLRLIQSLGGGEGFYHSLTLGFDWKHFGEDLILGADTDSAPITYVPATLSWRGDWSGEGRKTDLTLTGVLGIRGLGSGPAGFYTKRYHARDGFVILKVDAGHEADLFAGIQGAVRVSGQWSPDPLISNEGFSIGGMSSVRGYFESEALTDFGVVSQVELRSPDFASAIGGPISKLRLRSFFDWGWGGIYEAGPSQTRRYRFGSVGVGGDIGFFNHLSGAIDVGVPLRNGPDSQSGDVFVRFKIQGEF